MTLRIIAVAAMAILANNNGSHAFSSTLRKTSVRMSSSPVVRSSSSSSHSHLWAASSSSSEEEQRAKDDEIDRLRSMAAKLRAEAAQLESQRAQELADAAERAFRKFDLNDDGKISLEELKLGLEKALQTELPEKRVKKLMDDLDVSGDGNLQLDEFVGVESFRNKLEALAREEKRQAEEAKKVAMQESEKAKIAEAVVGLLNEKEPTNTDKVLSILPYLFPLLDSLAFGRFLIFDNTENPLFVILAVLFAVYRSIPFSGFAAFIALSVLSSNPSINRLIRFNMQQAIFLDIALFFPGLLGALSGLILGGAGVSIPQSIAVLGSNAIFITLLVTVTYCSVSSLLGITPDKIPLISKSVEDRMPSVDMFDQSTGQFTPRDRNSDKDEKDKKK